MLSPECVPLAVFAVGTSTRDGAFHEHNLNARESSSRSVLHACAPSNAGASCSPRRSPAPQVVATPAVLPRDV